METRDSDLPELFWRATKHIRRNLGARLAPLGLTPGQERALRILGRAGEPLRMTALAQRLDIVPRSATTVIDALTAAGLVTRETDPDNRRSILVTLSAEGHATLAEMAAARRAATEELFESLSPAQRDTLRDLLATLVPPRSATAHTGRATK